MSAQHEQLLSTGDVARILEITPDGVRHLERVGKLRARRTVSGHRIFSAADVEELAAARRRGPSVGELPR
jgi:DNA-binding transcriptional MerR regulator